MCFVAFTFFYKHFFDNCIVEKECVFVSKKTNKKKIKKVEIPKRLLSIIYFILVCLLYYYINANVFICLTCIIVIFVLRMCQKFDESLIDILFVLDNNIIVKALYFSFYWICKFLFYIFTPLYKRLESKKNNNFDSVKDLFIKRLGNTEYGSLLPLLGFSNDKNNNKNKEEGIGNIMNIFGDLGDLHKLFEDTKSSTKTLTSTDESNTKDKISDPKWLKRSTLSSTDNLDKYILSNIASNKDINKTINLNNHKKIIEINENDNKKNDSKKNDSKKNNSKKNDSKKNNSKKNNSKKNNSKKNDNNKNDNNKNDSKKNDNNKNDNNKNDNKKNDNKNSEELVNLYKKMNDVFSSMPINKK